MPLFREDLTTPVTQATFTTDLVEIPQPPVYRVPYDIYETSGYDGEAYPKRSRMALRFHEGQIITPADIEAAYVEITVSGISPASGPAAGGTVVTVRGDGVGDATAVTFDGAAGAALTVVSEDEVTVTTPAHLAGAVDVTVVAPENTVTLAGGYTYA